jgi:hypothetical protein
MNPTISNTEPRPSTLLRKPVAGGFLKSILAALFVAADVQGTGNPVTVRDCGGALYSSRFYDVVVLP